MPKFSKQYRRDASAFDKISNFRLCESDVHRLALKQRSASRALLSAGWPRTKVDAALQSDINDAFERKSAACAYEQERARQILLNVSEALDSSDALCVCLGNPRCRRPIGRLSSVDVRAIFRKWKQVCFALSKDGLAIKSFAVVEVHLVKPEDEDPFWEPHVHGILTGAPPEAVRAQCHVRADKSRYPSRSRHTNIKPVHNLAGAITYAAKFLPQSTHSYSTEERKNWADNDLRGATLAEWTEWMACYRVADLLAFRGIDLRSVGLSSTSEMATKHHLDGQLLSEVAQRCGCGAQLGLRRRNCN